MANNTWKNYTQKSTALSDNDEVMLLDSTDNKNKRGLMSKFWDYVVDKMATAVISKLQTNNKTIIGAINALSGRMQFGSIREGETKEITFDSSTGCLMVFYHPYYYTGVYGFVPYYNNDVSLITTISNASGVTLSLTGLTIKITSSNDYSFCIFKL